MGFTSIEWAGGQGRPAQADGDLHTSRVHKAMGPSIPGAERQITMRKTAILILLALTLLGGCASTVPNFDGLVIVRSQDNSGSGAVIARDPGSFYIATACHVVTDDNSPRVDSYNAETVARDQVRDIAILRVTDVGQDWTVLKLANAAQGEAVTAVGWTRQAGEVRRLIYRGHVITTQWDGQYHQQGAAINTGGYPGMSGGPVLNSRGQCIGIMRGCAPVGMSLLDSTTIIAPAREIRAVMESI